MSQVINVCRKDKTRRIAIESNDLTLESLHSKTLNLYPGLSKKNKCIDLVWKDEDGEFVAVSSDQDLRDAMKAMSNKKLTFTIVIKKNPKNDLFEEKEPVDSSSKISELKVGICRAWKKDGDDDVKEITLAGAVHQIKFKDIYQAAVATYPGVARKFQKGKKTFILQWIDEKESPVTISCDAELHDAIHCMQEHGRPLLFQIEKDTISKNENHCYEECHDTAAIKINLIGLDGKPKASRRVVLISDISFDNIREATFKAFPKVAQLIRKEKMIFTLEMKKEDVGVTITNDDDLQEALEYSKNRNLPLEFDIITKLGKDIKKRVVLKKRLMNYGNADFAIDEKQSIDSQCTVRRPKTGNKQRVRFEFPTDIDSAEGSYLAFKTLARDAIAGLRPKDLGKLQLMWVHSLVDGAEESVAINNDKDLVTAAAYCKEHDTALSFDIELIGKVRNNA